MTGKNHLLFGFGAGTALYWDIVTTQNDIGLLTVGTYMTICGITMLGSIVPDIDNTKSMIGSKLKCFSVPINKLFGHRTLFHSLLIIFVFFSLLHVHCGNWSFVSNMYFISFITGYIGHLVQDTMTKGGTPWLYPFVRNRISLTNVRYNSKAELLITICLIVVYCLMMTKKEVIISFFQFL